MVVVTMISTQAWKDRHLEQLVEICYHLIGNSLVILLLRPSFTLEPYSLATRLLCRFDIFIEAVADDNAFFRFQSESLYSKQIYPVVRLAYADHSRFYYVLEIFVESELLEHSCYVSIKIAYENHRITLSQPRKDRCAMGSYIDHLLVYIIEDGTVLFCENILVGIPSP